MGVECVGGDDKELSLCVEFLSPPPLTFTWLHN